MDVLHVLDEKCSGRNVCDVPGTDVDLRREQPCHHGLTLYLEPVYECLTGRQTLIKIIKSPINLNFSSTKCSSVMDV